MKREEIINYLSLEEKFTSRRIIVSYLLALFSINTLLLCADVVLPTYIKEHHKDYITEEKLSIIFG